MRIKRGEITLSCNTNMRIIIAGSRNFSDYELLVCVADQIISELNCHNETIQIISGGAVGADQLGERYAKQRGYRCMRFPADWNKYGRRAGYLRNLQMAEHAISDDSHGVLIALWDGESKGTGHMINIARTHGLDIHIVNYKTGGVSNEHSGRY